MGSAKTPSASECPPGSYLPVDTVMSLIIQRRLNNFISSDGSWIRRMRQMRECTSYFSQKSLVFNNNHAAYKEKRATKMREKADTAEK